MCKRIRDLIDLYVAGDLEPQEAREVESHLAECEACSREAASYRRCLGNLATLSSENQPNRLSPFFWQGIQKEILTGQEQQVEPGRGRVRWVVYGLAAAILIAVTAYLAGGLFSGSGVTPSRNGGGIVRDVPVVEDGVILPPGTPWVPEMNRMEPADRPESTENSLEF